MHKGQIIHRRQLSSVGAHNRLQFICHLLATNVQHLQPDEMSEGSLGMLHDNPAVKQ